MDVAIVVLAALGAWALVAIALALLAGGVIRNREERDARCAAGARIANL